MTRAAHRETAQADILAAAAAIIARHGYHGTSMRDLAKSTGRGLSSFYTYFASKEALLFALQSRAFVALIEAAEAAAAATEHPDRRLYAVILNHVQYFASHNDVMRVLVQEAKVLPARQRRQVRALKERYFAMVRDLVLELGSDRAGTFAAGVSRQEVERITYSLFGMLNWVWAWYEPKQHGTARDVARTIHATIHRALTGRAPARPSWTAVDAALDRLALRSLISPQPNGPSAAG
ncbi:MAG: TetR/AcrR family transcriptional regulator [Acidobacteriota bacterium]